MEGLQMKHKVISGVDILGIIEKYYLGVNEIYLCSPFLSVETIRALLDILQQKSQINLKLITKYDPIDLLLNASDQQAFEYVFEKSAHYQKWNIEVYILNNLHTKAVVLGTKAAIVGSFNLTNSGFHRNQEMGIAIWDEDSKIRTIRDRLQDYTKHGDRLSKKDFELFCQNDLPRFEGRVRKIRKLMNDIRKERDAGLQSFVSESDSVNGINYLDGIYAILKFISKKSRSQKECIKWLNERAPREGKEINAHRLNFIQNLGLVSRTSDRISVSEFGKAVLRQKSPQKFYRRLVVRYPEFLDLQEQLAKQSRVHPKEIAENISYGGQEYWAARLRWLESLGKVKPVIENRYKYYQKKEE